MLMVIIGIGLWSRLTTIKKLRNKIQESSELLNAEKIRAERGERFKERFLANLSHEIRTPMNAIMGITSMLIKNKHYKKQSEYLKALNISSKHLLLLINDILDLSKLEAGKFEIEKSFFNIPDIFHKVENGLGNAAMNKGLQLRFILVSKLPSPIYGDQNMLEQILLNLCRNAIEFTAEGKIEVSCKAQELSNDKVSMQFIVKDTGIGIRQEIRDKIFSEFIGDLDFDKRYIDQSGLGLLLVKQMLQLQGGSIRVETITNKGSSFIFELPYEINKIDTTAKHAVSNKNKVHKDLKGIKILLVEDNEFNVMVAKDQLEDAIENVAIEVAVNGETALELIQNNEFDLVLMDIQMPVMNGYEATHAIRNLDNKASNIPIIAMTANNVKSEIEKCYKSGMNDYLSKPFETIILIEKITSAINFPERNLLVN
jgi:CheY-like chemotaxis protein